MPVSQGPYSTSSHRLCFPGLGETQGARDGNRKNRLPTQTGATPRLPRPAAQKSLPYNAFCVSPEDIGLVLLLK